MHEVCCMRHFRLAAVVGFLVVPGVSSAVEAANGAVVDTEVGWRGQWLDWDRYPDTAELQAVRAAFRFRTPSQAGFSLLAGTTGVLLVDQRHWDDPDLPGRDGPELSEHQDMVLSRLALLYDRGKGAPLRMAAGRQVINWDGGRFVGTDSWRLHEQTFDAVSLHLGRTDQAFADLAYAWRVTRGDGADEDLSAGLAHGEYLLGDWLRLRAHAEVLDFAEQDAWDSATAGIGAEVRYGLLSWLEGTSRLDLAGQSAWADRSDYFATYGHFEVGVNLPLTLDGLGPARLAGQAGIDWRGSDDNRAAFATPLADNLIWNGRLGRWAMPHRRGTRALLLRGQGEAALGRGWRVASTIDFWDWFDDRGTLWEGKEFDAGGTITNGLWQAGLMWAHYYAPDWGTWNIERSLWVWAGVAF